MAMDSASLKRVQVALAVFLVGGVLIYFLLTAWKVPPKCGDEKAIALLVQRAKTQPFYRGGEVTVTNVRTDDATDTYAVCVADVTIAKDGQSTPYKDVNYTLTAESSGGWGLTMPGWQPPGPQLPPREE